MSRRETVPSGVVAWSGVALALTCLAVAVSVVHGPFGVDSALLDVLRRHPGPVSVARVLTRAGSGLVDGIVLTVALAAAARLRVPGCCSPGPCSCSARLCVFCSVGSWTGRDRRSRTA